jgi:hypothetical protein
MGLMLHDLVAICPFQAATCLVCWEISNRSLYRACAGKNMRIGTLIYSIYQCTDRVPSLLDLYLAGYYRTGSIVGH